MTQQFGDTLRNAIANTIETTIGTSPKCRAYSGAPPANCAAAASGTQLGEGTWPSDWLTNASAGTKTKNGTLTISITVGGTLGYYRVYDNAGSVCHEQGTIGQAIGMILTATAAAYTNLLTVSSTTGLAVDMFVTGTGIPTGSRILELTGTTVRISGAVLIALNSGTTVVFGSLSGDFRVPNLVVTNGQVLTVDAKTYIAPGP